MKKVEKKIVDLKGRVEAVATEKHPSYKVGEKFTCGKIAFERLLEKEYVKGGATPVAEPATEKTTSKK